MINEQVPLEELMDERVVTFEPIAAKYFWIIIIRILLFFTVVFAGANFLANANYLAAYFYYLINGTLLLLLFIWILVMKFNFKYRGVAVRAKDVIFRTSFINITETIVPYNRVQHVKLTRGVLEKFFGLSTVHIYTAAGNGQNLSIAGLKANDADKLKSFIIEKLKENDTLTPEIPEPTTAMPVTEDLPAPDQENNTRDAEA